MNLLDRSLIRGFLKSYFVVLVSLLSLYVIVDLFMNLDEFADKHRGLSGVLMHIGTYYGYRLSQIFDRLSEAHRPPGGRVRVSPPWTFGGESGAGHSPDRFRVANRPGGS